MKSGLFSAAFTHLANVLGATPTSIPASRMLCMHTNTSATPCTTTDRSCLNRCVTVPVDAVKVPPQTEHRKRRTPAAVVPCERTFPALTTPYMAHPRLEHATLRGLATAVQRRRRGNRSVHHTIPTRNETLFKEACRFEGIGSFFGGKALRSRGGAHARIVNRRAHTFRKPPARPLTNERAGAVLSPRAQTVAPATT